MIMASDSLTEIFAAHSRLFVNSLNSTVTLRTMELLEPDPSMVPFSPPLGYSLATMTSVALITACTYSRRELQPLDGFLGDGSHHFFASVQPNDHRRHDRAVVDSDDRSR